MASQNRKVLFLLLLTLGMLVLITSCAVPVPSEQPAPTATGTLVISAPFTAEVREEVLVKVTSRGQPVDGVSIKANAEVKITDGGGIGALIFESTGAFKITATREGYDDVSVGINIYPKGNEQIPIRGFCWDESILGTDPHVMRSAGANYVWLKQNYDIDNEFNLLPCIRTFGLYPEGPEYVSQQEAMRLIEYMICEAHTYGLKVHLVAVFLMWKDKPNVGPEQVPEQHKDDFLERLSHIVLRWAEFAERNGVEMLSPVCDLETYIGCERSWKWHHEMLPKLREKFSGKLVVDGPFDIMFSKCDFNYAGYDYVGTGMYAQHVNSWEEARQMIRTYLDYLDLAKKKYGVKTLFTRVGPLGVNSAGLLKGYEDDPVKAKVKFWEVVMEESIGRVDGFCFYSAEYPGPRPVCGEKGPQGWFFKEIVQGKEPYYSVRNFFTESYDAPQLSPLIRAESIVIDGDDNDWHDMGPVCVDSITDVPYEWVWGYAPPDDNSKVNIKEFYAAIDEKYLYVMCKFVGPPNIGLKISLDTDLDGAEDYHIYTSAPRNGDVSIMSSVIGEDCHWIHQHVAEAKIAYGKVVEVRIPLEAIRVPKKLAITVWSLTESEIVSFDLDRCGEQELNLDIKPMSEGTEYSETRAQHRTLSHLL